MATPNFSGAMFREVSVPASNSARWKSITICTGASASTLQDIKVPESSGGYSFKDSSVPASGVRNRFIYWRTYQDVVELVEESLDTTLSGNMVRFCFQDTPVLPCVTIHEVNSTVVVLLATVASVHRLVFPHPSRLTRQQTFVLNEQVSTSIFYDASLPADPRNQYLLTPGGSINAQLLRATSCVADDGCALFAMATTTGSLLLVKMPPMGLAGVVIQQELSSSSMMKKLWNGLIPGAMKGSQPAVETAAALEMIHLNGDVYVFTICRDCRLRVWSTKTKECVFADNVLDYSSEQTEDNSVPVTYTDTNRGLKAVLGGSNNGICVFITLQNKTKFIFLRPAVINGRFKLELLTSLDKTPVEDLVDFVVTEKFLLSLWTTQAGETQVLALPLTQCEENESCAWESVYLHQNLDQVVVPPNCDPREVFLAKIFSPGLFAPQDIVRALNVYRHCSVTAVDSDVLYNMTALKDEVTNALDTEIRNSVSDYEVQEEAYIDLQRKQWEKFYSCCCQYKQVGEKAKGLFADPLTGLFGVIKKTTFSLLRPCDRTEMLYLSPTSRLPESVIEAEGLAGEDMTAALFAEDLRLLCNAVQLISANIEPEVATDFLNSLQSLQEPDELVSKFTLQLCADADLMGSIESLVRAMNSPVVTIETVFSMLHVVDDLGSDLIEAPEGCGYAHYSHLFCGSLGMAVLTQSFHQLAYLRFNFTRDLALFLSIVANPHDKFHLPATLSQDMLDTLSNELLPTACHLLRCYKVLVWAADALSTVSSNNTLDTNLRQLSNLEITDKEGVHAITQLGSEPNHLVRLFLEGVGGDQIRRRLSATSEGSPDVWKSDLHQFLLSLAVLIWPASEASLLLEFLVRSCQYLRLEELNHLLTPWCTWNESSRAFFLGLAHLHFDEPFKAVAMFEKASDGVATESFLLDKFLQTEETDFRKLQILYYLKVINHLEEHGLRDLVIATATKAIKQALPDDPNQPTLQSKIFMQHLELGHNQEAFTAMMNNPDPDRRKDCLRQFLVVLCDRGHLTDLVSFDYGDLEEEVVYIMENRARSVDLSSRDYYNLLFSFFIHREDYRKAGRVMFERGLRLSQEVPGLRSLQQQAQSYLAALNTLHLVHPDYAWIIKPKLRSSQPGQEEDDRSRLGKHGLDGQTKSDSHGTTKLEILELADLQKEYLLLDARLRLIRNQPDSALVSGPMPSPQELLSLLCSAGLYDVAVSVTQAFSLPADTVLTSLSLRCVSMATMKTEGPTQLSASLNLMKAPAHDPTSDAWLWLRENKVPPCGARETTASDKAWSLLQSYLSVLEDGSGRGHKCVAHTLLAQGFHLPTWLVTSYKSLDVSSLLRMYLTFDLLTQAGSLACEYLEGVTDSLTGSDEPTFKIKGQDKPSPLSVWIPYTCMDQLLAALRESNNKSYTAMYQKVREKLDVYQTKSFEFSQQISAY